MLDLAFAVGLGRAAMARTASLALVVLLTTSFAGAAPGPVPATTDVVLVLDASGSMFNELEDGRYRITAAKEALATFVSRLPEDAGLNVGLRVYGSQMMALEEGACEDSLLQVPVAPLDRALLLGTVQATEAMGATPIAYSLERAAEDLAGATGRKIVVLVTDGEESCGGDVRVVAERLAAAGIEIDLHVVGFALDETATRSFEGVGTFHSANSAAELAEALGKAVAAPALEAEPLLSVTVRLTRDGQPATSGATVQFRDAVGSAEHQLRPGTQAGTFTAELPAGSYVAAVADAFSAGPSTFSGLSVSPGAANEFSFELAPAFDVELSVEPDRPTMGSRATVSFSGATAAAEAWITVAPVDAPDDRLLAVEAVRGSAGSADVLVPFGSSRLEARYHLILPEGGTRLVGRSAPFEAVDVTASLQAPTEVQGGAGFEVRWEGPANESDLLTIAPVGSDPATMLSYSFAAFGNPATLTAPTEEGAYEVRYVAGGGGGVLATLPVLVVASEVGLSVAAEAQAGSTVPVAWRGPDGPGDMVVFAPQGAPEGSYLSYAFTAWGATLELTAPVEAGAYEVRYVSAAEGKTLASAAVTVTPAHVTLDAVPDVAASAVFDVTWTGPNGAGDYITVVPVGAREDEYLSVAFTAWGPTLELTAPDTPGSYEIRYVSGFARTVLGSVPLTVR